MEKYGFIGTKVVVKNQGHARHIMMNNPSKLNTFGQELVTTISSSLRLMEESSSNGVIILSSPKGKVFSAGAEVRGVLDGAINKGDVKSLFDVAINDYYQMLYFMGRMKNPIVSVINGLAMGSGAMTTGFGPFRVATEKSGFAMGEALLGSFADAGANFVLSRMDRNIGIYLGLSGNRLNAEDLLFCGLATHFVKSENLEALYDTLSSYESPTHDDVNSVLEKFSVDLNHKPTHYTLWGDRMNTIENCFKYSTVEEIINALKADGSEFALKTIDQMLAGCPTSLKVTLESLRLGAIYSASQSLNLESHLWSLMSIQNNFKEGVTSKLIDKRKPNWDPADIESVDLENDIRKKFFKLDENQKLIVDTRKDYYISPYNNYMLPSSKEIMKVYQSKNKNLQDTISWFLNRQNKFGVQEKIKDVVSSLETSNQRSKLSKAKL